MLQHFTTANERGEIPRKGTKCRPRPRLLKRSFWGFIHGFEGSLVARASWKAPVLWWLMHVSAACEEWQAVSYWMESLATRERHWRADADRRIESSGRII